MRQIGTETSDDALGGFFAEHGQALLRFAFLLTSGRGADAEDLVQTVLARLVARGLDDLSDPVAYARRGIVNEHRSAGRHAAVERKVHPQLVTGESSECSPQPDDRMTILGALDSLTDRERAAVVMRYHEDLPDDQIAVVLGCLRPTVRSLIHRAMPKLRRRLGDAYDSADSAAHQSPERGIHDDEV